jgi:hypothetical protein
MQHGGFQPESGGPKRPNYGLIGAIVIGCTTLLLGSALLITLSATKGGDKEDDLVQGGGETSEDVESPEPSEDPTPDEETSEDVVEPDPDLDPIDTSDPKSVAVGVLEILYGLRDEKGRPYVCKSPSDDLEFIDYASSILADVDIAGIIDEFRGSVVTQDSSDAIVDVKGVYFGSAQPLATVSLIYEDSQWKACGLEWAEY